MTAPITFGVDLTAVFQRLDTLEQHMATEAEQITALSAKVDDLVSDVRAALELLRADKANFSDEGQAAFDELTAKVAAFDAEVGDADGSDAPAETPGDVETPVAE